MRRMAAPPAYGCSTWLCSGVAIFLCSLSLWVAPARANEQSNSCVHVSLSRLYAHSESSHVGQGVMENAVHTRGFRDNQKGVATVLLAKNADALRGARRWFEQGARKGYAPAQVNLAVMYLSGSGTQVNEGTAIYWLELAARQHSAFAYFALGLLYMKGCGVRQDYQEAFSLFQRGAEGGDPSAQLNLGYLYDNGLGVPQDRSQAAIWYRAAAEAGQAQAQLNLGQLYALGEGVPHDERAAFVWFQKAALQGHPGAQVTVGSWYAQGIGTNKDLLSACVWLLAARQQGDDEGAETLQAVEAQLSVSQLIQSKKRAQSLVVSRYETVILKTVLFH